MQRVLAELLLQLGEDPGSWIDDLAKEGVSSAQDLLLLPGDNALQPRANELLQLLAPPARIPPPTASPASVTGKKKPRLLKKRKKDLYVITIIR